jgi:hypothetical protein
MTRSKGKSQMKANAVQPSTKELKQIHFNAMLAAWPSMWAAQNPLRDKAWEGLTTSKQKGEASGKLHATQEYKDATRSGFVTGYLSYLMSAGIKTDGITFVETKTPHRSPMMAVDAAGNAFLSEDDAKAFHAAKSETEQKAQLDAIRDGRTVEEFLEDFDGYRGPMGCGCFDASIAAVCAYPERLTYVEGLVHIPCTGECCCPGVVLLHAWVKDITTGQTYDSSPVEGAVIIGTKEFKRGDIMVCPDEPLSEPMEWTTQTTLAEQQAMLIEAGFEPELWQEVEGQEGSTQVDIANVDMNLSITDACYEYNKALDSDDHDYPMSGEPGCPDFYWLARKARVIPIMTLREAAGA